MRISERTLKRRTFLKASAAALAAPVSLRAAPQRRFEISVAGWSLHREVARGRRSQIELFQLVREEFDIRAFELVNSMLRVPTLAYVQRLAAAAGKAGVSIPLIMVDSEGNLGADSREESQQAVQYHSKWVDVAADLGCHSIRVNWGGWAPEVMGDPAAANAFIERSSTGFSQLVEIAQKRNLHVLIENHGGGPSTQPEMLARLIERVGPGLGTLPDFGNFPEGTDRYASVDAMMPFARAVSAKCYDFDELGEETQTDYERMLQIVVDKHKYGGFIGIEYEGDRLGELEGIRRCHSLLRRLRGDAVKAVGAS